MNYKPKAQPWNYFPNGNPTNPFRPEMASPEIKSVLHETTNSDVQSSESSTVSQSAPASVPPETRLSPQCTANKIRKVKLTKDNSELLFLARQPKTKQDPKAILQQLHKDRQAPDCHDKDLMTRDDAKAKKAKTRKGKPNKQQYSRNSSASNDITSDLNKASTFPDVFVDWNHTKNEQQHSPNFSASNDSTSDLNKASTFPDVLVDRNHPKSRRKRWVEARTREHLMSLLDTEECKKYKSLFIYHEISYLQFLSIKEKDLISIGIENEADRKSIMSMIEENRLLVQMSNSKIKKYLDRDITYDDIKNVLINAGEQMDFMTRQIQQINLLVRTDEFADEIQVGRFFNEQFEDYYGENGIGKELALLESDIDQFAEMLDRRYSAQQHKFENKEEPLPKSDKPLINSRFTFSGTNGLRRFNMNFGIVFGFGITTFTTMTFYFLKLRSQL